MELGRNQFQFPPPHLFLLFQRKKMREKERERERERGGEGETKKKSGSVRSLNTFRLGVRMPLYDSLCLCTGYSAIYLSRLFTSFQKLPAAWILLTFLIPSNLLVFIRNIAATRDRNFYFSYPRDIYSFAEIIFRRWQMQCMLHEADTNSYISTKSYDLVYIWQQNQSWKRFTNIFKPLRHRLFSYVFSNESFTIQLLSTNCNVLEYIRENARAQSDTYFTRLISIRDSSSKSR